MELQHHSVKKDLLGVSEGGLVIQMEISVATIHWEAEDKPGDSSIDVLEDQKQTVWGCIHFSS
jgi:hypothetical protein